MTSKNIISGCKTKISTQDGSSHRPLITIDTSPKSNSTKLCTRPATCSVSTTWEPIRCGKPVPIEFMSKPTIISASSCNFSTIPASNDPQVSRPGPGQLRLGQLPHITLVFMKQLSPQPLTSWCAGDATQAGFPQGRRH